MPCLNEVCYFLPCPVTLVGMRTALQMYIPKLSKAGASIPVNRKISVGLRASSPQTPSMIAQWCWKETPHMMHNHSAASIVGDPSLCWIKYDDEANTKLAHAYRKKGGLGIVSPLTGYKVDLEKMVQTKLATGFQRDVQRVLGSSGATTPVPPSPPPKEIDLDEGYKGDSVPEDLTLEPQMVFVEGDVLQISKQRQDGWAFGTKVRLSRLCLLILLVIYSVVIFQTHTVDSVQFDSCITLMRLLHDN